MEQIIKVDSIVTKFETNIVHNGISFSINKGTIVGLIGGSGSGKSTLLREILGLLRPTSGSIYVQGEDIWATTEDRLNILRRRWGVLFQSGALFSALTVGENVAAPLIEQSDLPANEIDAVVSLRLALSGLDDSVIDLMPSELSGGMRKRAALARALALEPEILFLDEPTSGLDPINARKFDTLVKTLSDSLNLTIVIVTHDLDSILSIVDQLIVLDQGKIIADDTVENVQKVQHPWIQEYFSARAKVAA